MCFGEVDFEKVMVLWGVRLAEIALYFGDNSWGGLWLLVPFWEPLNGLPYEKIYLAKQANIACVFTYSFYAGGASAERWVAAGM